MINPYILKHTSTMAPAHMVNTFLRDYFNICQHNRGTQKEVTAVNSLMVHNLEDETAFPVWVVQCGDTYGITHDPNELPKERYNSVQMLTDEPFNPRLKRVASTLYSFSNYAYAEDTAQTVLRSLRGWHEQALPHDESCSLFLVGKDERFGVIDPLGKTVVPPIYRYIIPMTLTADRISLLICRRDRENANTTDVYDVSGNCLYRNIGGLYRYEDTVRYHFSPAEGNKPSSRFAEKVCIVMHGDSEDAQPQTFIRVARLLRHSPALEKDDGPQRLHAMCDETATALETDKFALSELKDILAPMAKVVAAWRGETPEEVMLSIPVWNVARQTENALTGVTADTALIDMPDMSIACFELLQRAGLHTVADVAHADLFPLCEHIDERLALEVCVLQGQIRTTLKNQ